MCQVIRGVGYYLRAPLYVMSLTIFLLQSIPGPGPNQIGILGSGDFGRALAGRLAQAGYTPVIGSRNPQISRYGAESPFPHLEVVL